MNKLAMKINDMIKRKDITIWDIFTILTIVISVSYTVGYTNGFNSGFDACVYIANNFSDITGKL